MDEEKRQRRGVIAFDHPGLLAMGVKAGDTVGYGASADYDMEVDGENMLRMLLQEILYVEEAS
jgi:co-chaperonin GroES (HSP10)